MLDEASALESMMEDNNKKYYFPFHSPHSSAVHEHFFQHSVSLGTPRVHLENEEDERGVEESSSNHWLRVMSLNSNQPHQPTDLMTSSAVAARHQDVMSLNNVGKPASQISDYKLASQQHPISATPLLMTESGVSIRYPTDSTEKYAGAAAVSPSSINRATSTIDAPQQPHYDRMMELAAVAERRKYSRFASVSSKAGFLFHNYHRERLLVQQKRQKDVLEVGEAQQQEELLMREEGDVDLGQAHQGDLVDEAGDQLMQQQQHRRLFRANAWPYPHSQGGFMVSSGYRQRCSTQQFRDDEADDEDNPDGLIPCSDAFKHSSRYWNSLPSGPGQGNAYAFKNSFPNGTTSSGIEDIPSPALFGNSAFHPPPPPFMNLGSGSGCSEPHPNWRYDMAALAPSALNVAAAAGMGISTSLMDHHAASASSLMRMDPGTGGVPGGGHTFFPASMNINVSMNMNLGLRAAPSSQGGFLRPSPYECMTNYSSDPYHQPHPGSSIAFPELGPAASSSSMAELGEPSLPPFCYISPRAAPQSAFINSANPTSGLDDLVVTGSLRKSATSVNNPSTTGPNFFFPYSPTLYRRLNPSGVIEVAASTSHSTNRAAAAVAAAAAAAQRLINGPSSDSVTGHPHHLHETHQAPPLPASTRASTTAASSTVNRCKVCGKSYARPSTLKTHMRTHSGEKPYKCSICCRTFSQAANLTAHLRIHSGEKPFKCPVCTRRFSQSSSVTTHMRTHSGERPYRCPDVECQKAFSDSSTLTKHMRVHSGEKPYKCKICLLSFSQSGNLNRHMKVHEIKNG